MPRLQSKRLAVPDEVRSFPGGRAVVINVGETAVGARRLRPGLALDDPYPADRRHRALPAPSPRLLDLGCDACGDPRRSGDRHRAGVDLRDPPGHDAWVVGDEPWTTLEWTSARTFGVPAEGPGESILLSVLFTDIVDSTATLQRIGDVAWRDLLIAHNRLLCATSSTRSVGARWPRPATDSLAVFDGAKRAVRCGMAMVRTATSLGLSIRVGIHTGEVEFVGDEAPRPGRPRGSPGHVACGTGRGPRLGDDTRSPRGLRGRPRGRGVRTS